MIFYLLLLSLSFLSLFSMDKQIESFKNKDIDNRMIKIQRDKFGFTISDDKKNINIPNYNVHRDLRGLENDKLTALLSNNSRYLIVNEQEDGSHSLEVAVRGPGGGPVCGRAAYFGVKYGLYGLMAVGVGGIIWKSRKLTQAFEVEAMDMAKVGIARHYGLQGAPMVIMEKLPNFKAGASKLSHRACRRLINRIVKNYSGDLGCLKASAEAFISFGSGPSGIGPATLNAGLSYIGKNNDTINQAGQVFVFNGLATANSDVAQKALKATTLFAPSAAKLGFWGRAVESVKSLGVVGVAIEAAAAGACAAVTAIPWLP